MKSLVSMSGRRPAQAAALPAESPALSRQDEPPAAFDKAMLSAGLALALQGGPQGMPDFLWTADTGTGCLDIWHPEPAIAAELAKSDHRDTLFQFCLAPQPGCAALAQAVSNHQSCDNLEVEWQDEHGRRRCWQISTRPLAGNPALTVGIVRDMTSAAEMCRKLGHQDEVSRGSREFAGRLAGVFASSLRQQISIIADFCELLTTPGDAATAAKRHPPGCEPENLRDIVRGMLDTASLMRDYAEAASGQLKVRTELCTLNEVVAETTAGLSGQLRQKALFLDIGFAQPGAHIRADITRLRQVVHLLARQIAQLATPGSLVRICADRENDGSASLTFTCRISNLPLSIWQAEPCAVVDARDPFLGHRFIDTVVSLHGGRLDICAASGGQRIVLSLPLVARLDADRQPDPPPQD
jgi:hypothetical protein